MQLLNRSNLNEPATVFVEPKEKELSLCEKYFDGFKPKTMKIALTIGLSITAIAIAWLVTHPIPMV